jgi:phage gp45-like
MSPYGLIHRPPDNSLALIMAQNGQTSNPIAIVDDPNNRTLKELAVGEVALSNYNTGTYLYMKEDNTAELVTDTLTIKTGGTTVTITDGQVTIDATNTTLTGNLQVDGTINSNVSVTAPQVTGTTDVTAGSIKLKGHTHGGSPTAPTGIVSPTQGPITGP